MWFWIWTVLYLISGVTGGGFAYKAYMMQGLGGTFYMIFSATGVLLTIIFGLGAWIVK